MKTIYRLALILLILWLVPDVVAIAQDSPHGAMTIACASCHTTDSWKMRSDADFSHKTTGFELAGAHKTVPCASCHKDLRFDRAQTACQSCHTDIHKGELGSTCIRCHTNQSWYIADMTQRHLQTRFPLVGRHATATCDQCHSATAGQQYVGTPVTCIGCHRADYQNATKPNHLTAGFSTGCLQCHDVAASSWGTGFDHNLTLFPLTGAHVATACVACHANNNFSVHYTGCAQCHQTDFTNASNPNHRAGNFSLTCQTCHSTSTWQPATFDHNSTHFQLTGAHQSVACQNCHTAGNYQLVYSSCVQCHQTDFNNTSNPAHVAGNFSTVCTVCHTTTAWSPSTFNHSATNFALTGAHQTTACQLCHTNGNYQTLVYSSCVQCHQTDFNNALSPNHRIAGYPANCLLCHTTSVWQPSTFDHNTTKLPLTGDHKNVACSACHTNNNYQLVYVSCSQCHQGDFNSAANPNHVAGSFPLTCADCHTTTAWSPSTFNHAITNFSLTGAHLTTSCQQCHTNGNYSSLKYSDCSKCHQIDFNKALNPNHVTGGFSNQCQTCHSTTAWQPATVDHSATHFPLTGAHIAVQCVTCHINNNYQLVYTACAQCHQTDFNLAMNPPHSAGTFPTICTSCHNTTVWSPSTFNHSTTNFTLTGAHLTTACQQCHTAGNYQSLAYSSCVQCHQQDYNNSVNPNHKTAGYPITCQDCHGTTVWKPANFNHSATKFALTGAHIAVQCISCHVNNNYQLAYTSCAQCHQTDFNTAMNPPHVAGGFSTVCTTCHTTTVWSPSTFNHSTTNFALTGAHLTTACQQCHTNGNYTTLTYTTCVACHQTDYNNSVNPNHKTAGYPTTCQDCHSTTGWSPATFNHSTTNFALTGAHIAVQCATCHTNNNYQLVYSSCAQCHQTDFNTAMTPPHVAGSFPTVCTTCHNTTVWSPSTFNHSTTNFTLTGAHLTTACQQCHTNGNYTTLPYTTCVACHQTDYNNSVNPNHKTAGYPTTCLNCHSTTAWSPAIFNHSTTNFALTGAHVAVQCAACHTNNNYQLVYSSCAQCHQTDFNTAMTPPHVAGAFPTVCTTCHNTTVWSPSTFNHSTTNFTLTGAHLTTTCQQCHTNGNYTTLTYTTCVACHQADYSGATNPNHQTAGYPTTCKDCHSTTAWSPATFNHSTTNFALTGAHVAVQCAACHTNNNYQLVYSSCAQCHQTDFNTAMTPPHVAGAFPTVCTTCHSTTVWSPSTFNHSTTNFTLTGAHLTTACQQCHTNGNYSTLKYTTCVACHQTDFNTAASPNHVTGGFSTVCTTCHSTTVWSPSTFNHSTTNFTLTGAHLTTTCQQCHTNGNYMTLKYTTCIACHQTDFNTAASPNHVTGGFSNVCQNCHSTTAWSPASFDHNTTKFPLTGAHLAVVCQTCHVNGNYQLVYSSCVQCHQTDYNGTTNPNHVTGGYPTVCQTCHSTTAWSPATFNHSTTKFALTGTHITTACASCHTNNNYQLVYTDCYACHQTDYAGATNPTHLAQAFPHACDGCHNTTVWTTLTYNHDTQYFKINSGTHRGRWTLCKDCHPSPSDYSAYTCTTSCHPASSMNSKHSGRTGYSYLSSACYGCHKGV